MHYGKHLLLHSANNILIGGGMNRRQFLMRGVPVASLFLGNANLGIAQVQTCERSPFLYGDGVADHTQAIQDAFDKAALMAKKVPNGVQKVEVLLSGVFNVKKNISIDATKIIVKGPATLIFDLVDSEYCITFNENGSSNSAYTNNVGSLFDSINFISKRKQNLFYCATINFADKNSVCLINITQCRFSGFDCIFTNGPGGWGWTWYMCGFNSCETLLNIKREKETYERYTFVSCIWQNGGVAFIVNNPDGKIYWTEGSFDYCKAIAIIKNGHVQISGHVEYKSRENALVKVLGRGSSFLFNGGSIFIRKNNNKYIIFEQAYDNQITMIGVNFLSDGINLKETIISNKKYNSFGINFGNQKTQEILKNHVAD